jgi:hypothetical protein
MKTLIDRAGGAPPTSHRWRREKIIGGAQAVHRRCFFWPHRRWSSLIGAALGSSWDTVFFLFEIYFIVFFNGKTSVVLPLFDGIFNYKFQ